MARLVYARAALIAGLATIVAAIWVAPRLWARTTDFDRELKRLAVEIASMPEGSTPEASTRRAFRLYQRATLTNRPGDFSETSGAVARALADKRSDIDLALLNAALDFRVHRLAATRRDLAPIPAGDADAELMRADVDLQDGLYDDARERYEAVVRRAPTSSMWSALARLAFLTAARGDTDGGDRLYAQAEDDLTAKDMRAYAWVEVQRGWTQFSRGRYDEAASHYRLAGRAYSGYWLVDEYTAELLGAEREFDEAIALYEQAIARAPRPDLYQQLGDLSMVARKPREAKQWHDRALAGYLESTGRGEVQFFHHLAAFYSDVRIDGAEAVKWARKDLELRHGYPAVDTLAWALYRHGEIAEAMETEKRALASGMADAHVYFHAATIARDAGQSEDAQRLLARVNEINPRYSDFHVHR